MTLHKTYIGAESLLTDSYRLAMMVLRSGFRYSGQRAVGAGTAG